MATSDGFGGPSKGSAGIYTYYERDGKTIMRAKHNKKSDRPPTKSRANQMSKFPNLVMAWRSFGGSLRDCFPHKRQGASAYNAFMAENLRRARVHLGKDMMQQDVCLADNFVVSLGGLPNNIQVYQSDDWMLSDIMVGNEPCGPDESVLAFSDRIRCNNGGRFGDGDEFLFVRMTQKINTNSRLPMVETTVNSFKLEYNPRMTLGNYFYLSGTRDGFEVVDGRLAARREKDSLVAWILKRKDRNGRWNVTCQALVGENSMLAEYIDTEAIDIAIDSYNPAQPPYLAPMPAPNPQAMVDAVSNNLQLGSVEGSGSYPIGSEVVLRAIPAEGSRFLCWDDGCESPERTLKVEHPLALKAIFAR